MDWDDADAGCKSQTALLGSIESQCEQNFVFELSKKAVTWIGGNDKTVEGTFVWPNGVEFYKSSAVVSGIFTNIWTTGFNAVSQNIQDCVSLRDTTGEWDDVVCTKTQNNYICEKAAYVGASAYVVPTMSNSGEFILKKVI